MSSIHVIILPYPAQGHVIPLLQFSYLLLNHGFKITFVNTEFNHHRIISSLSQKDKQLHEHLQLVSVPDGLGPTEDRNDLGKLCESLVHAMPPHLEEIITKSRQVEVHNDEITWMIADENMAWAFEVAIGMGLRVAAFWPAAAGMYATLKSIPKLIQAGFVDHTGRPKNSDMIEIIPGMPKMNPAQFPWNVFPDSKSQRILFQYFANNNKASELAEFTVCNSFHELESPVFTKMPSVLPVGPLTPQFTNPVGAFWTEDDSCLNWLDKQQPKSVVYVAFGSFTIFSQDQFQEIALGLELTGSPFLWVVRPDPTNKVNVYPDGFRERVEGRGKIVDWCPQQKVLAHPSIACFVSHCGWNSTVEGVRNGVPFLCKPYFIDQFFNERYICEVWNVGLRLKRNDNGVVMREEVRVKVEQLLGDEKIRMSSKKWKGTANASVGEGGLSYDNFNRIVSAMKVEKKQA